MAPASTTSSFKPSDNPPNTSDVKKLEKCLWTLEIVPGKGKGLVATQNIPPGTQVLSEGPLLTTAVINSIETQERDLANALRALPRESQRAFLSLYNKNPGKDPLSNIVMSNGYPLGPSSNVGGVFANISRINHSCRPNAHHAWNPILKEETVYAVRPILAGQEITLSYHAGGPSSDRQKELKEYFGFDCTCEVCSLPASKLRRSDARLIRAQHLDQAIGDPQAARNRPDKALANCRNLFEIYTAEDIKDDRLPRLYFDAFQICAKHSDRARAKVFCQKYCDVKRLSEGANGVNALEMMPYVRDPSKHESFGETKHWNSSLDQVPQDLDTESFEKWLWKVQA